MRSSRRRRRSSSSSGSGSSSAVGGRLQWGGVAGRRQFPDWKQLMAGIVAPEHLIKQQQQQQQRGRPQFLD
uniref:Uncharacterized protein n=1 Tax=Tetradesmus obliquus TaxID=3088 RepID=A0A383W7P8_TETOB